MVIVFVVFGDVCDVCVWLFVVVEVCDVVVCDGGWFMFEIEFLRGYYFMEGVNLRYEMMVVVSGMRGVLEGDGGVKRMVVVCVVEGVNEVCVDCVVYFC